MKHTKTGIQSTLGLCGLLAAFGAFATDITIFDKVAGNNFGSDSRAGIQEDNETEPGTISNQSWDLEAIYLNGKSLSIIGGFNFQAGNSGQNSGDIFIDVNGNATWGTDVYSGSSDGLFTVSNSTYKYDYVIHFTGRTFNGAGTDANQGLANLNYKVYSLTESTTQLTAYYRINDEANPFTWASGGTEVASGTATQTDLGTANYNGLTGGQRYALGGLDLSFLSDAELSGALFKFTMECGNDNIVGRVPDGGATVCLMGLGLTVLGLARRRVTA